MIGIDTTYLVCMEIKEHPMHEAAWASFRREALDANEGVAIAPQVLLEFIHVVTDPKRFARPLAISEAIVRATYWWTATESVHVYPTSESMLTCLDWLARFGLGRKRLLDTQLAATLWSAGVRRILTLNAADFGILPDMVTVTPDDHPVGENPKL